MIGKKLIEKGKIYQTFHVFRRCALKGAIKSHVFAQMIIAIEFLQMITLNLTFVSDAHYDVATDLLDTLLNLLSVVRLFKRYGVSVMILYWIFFAYYMILHLTMLIFVVYFKYLEHIKLVRRFITLIFMPLDLQNTIFQVSTTELILEGITCASTSAINNQCYTKTHGTMIFFSIILLIFNINSSLLANLFTFLTDFSHKKKFVQFAKNYNAHYTLLVLIKVIMVILFKFSVTRELSMVSQCFNCLAGLFLTYVYFKNLSYINEAICQAFGMWLFIFTVTSGLLLLQTLCEYIPVSELQRYPRSLIYFLFWPFSARMFFNLRERLKKSIINSRDLLVINEHRFEFLMRQIWHLLNSRGDNYYRLLNLLLILTNFKLVELVEFASLAPGKNTDMLLGEEETFNVLDDLNTHPLIAQTQGAFSKFIDRSYSTKLKSAKEDEKYFGVFMNYMSYNKNVAKNYTNTFRSIAVYKHYHKKRLNILNKLILNEYELTLQDELDASSANIDSNFASIGSFIKFDKNVQQLKKMISVVLPEIVGLYANFRSSSINLQVLRDTSAKILKQLMDIQTLFNRTVSISDKQREFNILYYYFRTEIVGYFCLQNHKTKEKFALTNIINHYDPSDMVSKDIIVDTKQNHYVYALLQDEIGKIFKHSVTFPELFLYKRREMKKMNLDNLMPSIFSQNHNQFMEAAVQKGALFKLNYPNRVVYAVNRHQLCFPLTISIKLEVFEGKLCAAGMLRHLKSSRGKFLLCDETGRLLNMSTELAEATQYDVQDLRYFYTLFTVKDFLPECTHQFKIEDNSVAISQKDLENFLATGTGAHNPSKFIQRHARGHLFLPVNLHQTCRNVSHVFKKQGTGSIASTAILESRNFRVFSTKFDIELRSYCEGSLNVYILIMHALQEITRPSIKEVLVKTYVSSSPGLINLTTRNSLKLLKNFINPSIPLKSELSAILNMSLNSSKLDTPRRPKESGSFSNYQKSESSTSQAGKSESRLNSKIEVSKKQKSKHNISRREIKSGNLFNGDQEEFQVADESGIQLNIHDEELTSRSMNFGFSMTTRQLLTSKETDLLFKGDETSRIDVSHREDMNDSQNIANVDNSLLNIVKEVQSSKVKVFDTRRESFAWNPLARFDNNPLNLVVGEKDGHKKLIKNQDIAETNKEPLFREIFKGASSCDLNQPSMTYEHVPAFGFQNGENDFKGKEATLHDQTNVVQEDMLAKYSANLLIDNPKENDLPILTVDTSALQSKRVYDKPLSTLLNLDSVDSNDYDKENHSDLPPLDVRPVATSDFDSPTRRRSTISQSESSCTSDSEGDEDDDTIKSIRQNNNQTSKIQGQSRLSRRASTFKEISAHPPPRKHEKSGYTTATNDPQTVLDIESKEESAEFTDIVSQGKNEKFAIDLRRGSLKKRVPHSLKQPSSESSIANHDNSDHSYTESLKNLEKKPHFIKAMSSIGWLAFLILQVLTLIVYLVVNSNLNEFLRYVQMADYPSYLVNGLGITFGNSEMMLLLNNDPLSQSDSITKIYQQEATLMSVGFNKYKVHYQEFILGDDLSESSNNVDYSDYRFNFSHFGVADIGSLNYQDASEFAVAHLQKVVNMSVSSFKSNDEVVIFFREYFMTYFSTYSNITDLLFKDVTDQRDKIINSLLIELILGILMSTSMCIIIYSVILYFERKENECLSLFFKFPIKELNDIQNRITQKAMMFFQMSLDYSEDLAEPAFYEKLKLASESKNTYLKSELARSSRSSRTKATIAEGRGPLIRRSKKVRYNWIVVLLFLFVNITMVGFYFIFYYAYMKRQIELFIPAMNKYNVFSSNLASIPAAYALSYHIINQYNQPALQKQNLIVSILPLLTSFESRKSKFQAFLTSELDDTVSSDFSTTEFKALILRYVNNDMCQGLNISQDARDACSSLLDHTSQFGIINVYNAVYQRLAYFRNIAIGTTNADEITNITNSKDFLDTYLMLYYLDLAMTDIIESQRLSLNKNINQDLLFIQLYFVFGVVFLVSFFLVFWNIFMKRVSNSYLRARQLLRMLPFENLRHNAHIKAYLTIRKK